MYGYGYMDMDMDMDMDVDMDMDMDIDVYHRPNLELACNVGCRHPIPTPPPPSTVRSRDHTVLYCTILLYSTKKEKICSQTDKQRTDGSKTETPLILSYSREL